MKERPLLFSAPMVWAILAGTKSQTRRVVSDRVPAKYKKLGWSGQSGGPVVPLSFCPYGQPGDHLWVRETFCLENTYDYHGDHDTPTDGRPVQKHETADGSYWLIPHYRATEPEPHIVPYRCDADDDKTRWTPSIYMPRWASRITLEIIGVRIERLNEITRGDCMAEGCPFPNMAQTTDPRGWFSDLWESINGPGSWEINPRVWVIEFRTMEPHRA